jgi:hypothetical protein
MGCMTARVARLLVTSRKRPVLIQLALTCTFDAGSVSRMSSFSSGGGAAEDGSDEVVFTTSEEDQKHIAALKEEMAAKAAEAKALAESAPTLPPAASVVPHVDIKPGRFKYVLIEAHDAKAGIVTHHTRSASGSYHADVAGEFPLCAQRPFGAWMP